MSVKQDAWTKTVILDVPHLKQTYRAEEPQVSHQTEMSDRMKKLHDELDRAKTSLAAFKAQVSTPETNSWIVSLDRTVEELEMMIEREKRIDDNQRNVNAYLNLMSASTKPMSPDILMQMMGVQMASPTTPSLFSVSNSIPYNRPENSDTVSEMTHTARINATRLNAQMAERESHKVYKERLEKERRFKKKIYWTIRRALHWARDYFWIF